MIVCVVLMNTCVHLHASYMSCVFLQKLRQQAFSLGYPPPPHSLFFVVSYPQATTLLIAVEDNATVMKAHAGALLGGSSSSSVSDRCMTVSSYLEAVGVLACHKAGVNPTCLTPEVPAIRRMPPAPAAATEGDVAAAPGGEGRSVGEKEVHSERLHALVDA